MLSFNGYFKCIIVRIIFVKLIIGVQLSCAAFVMLRCVVCLLCPVIVV